MSTRLLGELIIAVQILGIQLFKADWEVMDNNSFGKHLLICVILMAIDIIMVWLFVRAGFMVMGWEY